jgi:hypothetical protein
MRHLYWWRNRSFKIYIFFVWFAHNLESHISEDECILHLSPEYTFTVFPLPSFVFNLAYSNEYLKLACWNSQEGCVHAMEWQGAGIHATNLLKKLHASAKEPLAAASCSPH